MYAKDKNGVWYFSIRDNNGKQIKRQSSKWTKDDVKDAEYLFKKSMDQEVDDITVNQLYLIYVSAQQNQVKKSTLYGVDNRYNQFIKPTFGNKIISKIKSKQIIEWQSKLLADGYTNNTMRTIQATLKSLLTFGVKNEYIEVNPFKVSFKINKSERKTEMQFITPIEFNRFIKEMYGEHYIALFSVLFWTGIRYGEAVAISVEDVDFENNTIRINKTYDPVHQITTPPKTEASYRNVQMTGEIRDLLKKHIEWMSHFEYKHPDGVKKAILFGFDRYMNESSVKYRQMVACAKSGIKLIKIHEFRHSHVSVLINTRQFTSFEIGKRMGHSAKMVEEVYGHLFKESQELMVKTLDQIALEAHAIEEKEEERNPISAVIN